MSEKVVTGTGLLKTSCRSVIPLTRPSRHSKVAAMGILYMIRHGQASFGSANYDLLSETGVLQSRILAEYLLTVGLTPDALYSGAMERQKDTAGAKRILKEYAGRTVR